MSRSSLSRQLRATAAWLSAAAGVAFATATAAFPGGIAIPGISPDHLAAILPVLAIPLVVHAWGFAVRRVARGVGSAAHFARHYRTLSPATKIAALLLLIGAVVHLALLPAHVAIEPRTGILFALDVAGFTGALLLALTIRHWRIPAGLISLVTVASYTYYLQAGLESSDLVGVLTSAAELAVIPVALVGWIRLAWALPSRRFMALAMAGLVTLLATSTVARAAQGTSSLARAMGSLMPSPSGQTASMSSGSGAMSGSMAPGSMGGPTPGGAMTPGSSSATMTNSVCPSVPGMLTSTGMLMQPVPSTPPTPAQVAATDQLVAATTAGIAQYADVNAALAAGYKPSTRTNIPVVHMLNVKNLSDNPLANPAAPQSLVYAHSGSKWVLLGAMYLTNATCKEGPDIGGSLTDWHAHTNLCFNSQHVVTGSRPDASGQCPAGQTTHATPFMLHVYVVPNNPQGPFDLSKSAIVSALES